MADSHELARETRSSHAPLDLRTIHRESGLATFRKIAKLLARLEKITSAVSRHNAGPIKGLP